MIQTIPFGSTPIAPIPKVLPFNSKPLVPIASSQSTPTSQPIQQTSPSFLSEYGSGPSSIGSKLINTVNQGAQELSGPTGLTQLLAPTKAVFRGVGDIAGTVFHPIGGAIDAVTGGKLNEFFTKLANASPRQGSIIDRITNNPEVQKLATEHPQAGEDFNRLMNLVFLGQANATEPSLTTTIPRTEAQIQSIPQTVIKPVTDYISGGANKISDSIQEASLKLTPTQKVNLGDKLTEVKNYLSENNITGNPETRFQKITTDFNAKEDSLQNFLQTDAKDNVVPTKTLIDRLNNLKIKYSAGDVADLGAAGKQIDSAISRLSGYGNEIPTARLNNLKRSVFKEAYNGAGNKVLDWVENDIGNVYYDAIKENLANGTVGVSGENKPLLIDGKPIEKFNKDYSTIINARKILKAAQGKSQIGLAGQIVARLIGGTAGSVAGIPGEIGGAMIAKPVAEKIAGTATKSRVASMLRFKK